jgi:cytoskeletal protein CcmA (bactofilin family)
MAARTTGTVSLGDLLKRGTLQAPETLVIRRRSAPDIEGRVESDGNIRVDRAVYATPSAAAKHVLGVGSVDGWLRWRVPRLDGKTLAELREGDG